MKCANLNMHNESISVLIKWVILFREIGLHFIAYYWEVVLVFSVMA